MSNLNKKVYGRIDKWLRAPIEDKFINVFLDGICLKRCWAGEVNNVSVLVAIGVDQYGFLGIKEGAKEDKDCWIAFALFKRSRPIWR